MIEPIGSACNPVQAAFSPIYGLPCWRVRKGVGSFLFFEFGEPELTISDGSLPNAPPRPRPRRRVTVSGRWHLRIDCCDWFIVQDGEALAHSESNRRTIADGLGELDGQALLRVEVDAARGRSVLRFDLGGALYTRPYPPFPGDDVPWNEYEQWVLYEPTGWVLSFRADGCYSHQPGDTPPDGELHQPLPTLTEGATAVVANAPPAALEPHGNGSGRTDNPELAPAAIAFFARVLDHFHRGICLTDLDRHEEALAEYERVVELDPVCANAHYDRGSAWSELGRHGEALGAYDGVLDLEPSRAWAHSQRGIALADLGRHDEALAAYDRAVTLEPHEPAFHNNRGCSLRDLGRHEDALAAFGRAIGLAPEHPDYHRRGWELRSLARYEEALAAADRALDLGPEDADAHGLRGTILLDLRRHEDALAAYDRALDLRPASGAALFHRGVVLLRLGRHGEALEAADRALSLAPNDARAASAHLLRGSALGELGRHAEALGCLEHAIALRPEWPTSHLNRGKALAWLARYDEALAAYKQALELRPDWGEAEVGRRAVLERLDRKE